MKISASLFSTKKNIIEYSNDLFYSGAEFIHLDFLENHNTPIMIEDLPKYNNVFKLPIDVHLILSSIDKNLIETLNNSDITFLSIQYENLIDKKDLNLLSEYKGKWGIGIISTTHLSILENYISSINHVLVMCTVPGISGAKFDQSNIERIDTINSIFPSLKVFVDGGIEHLNANIMRNKKVELIVSGSYLSNAERLYQNLYSLKYGDQQLFVSQIMISKNKLPIQNSSSSFLDILKKVSEFKFGIVFIVNFELKFLGIITDGDLRRAIEKHQHNVFELKAIDLVNKKPFIVNQDELIINILHKRAYEMKKIDVIPVVEKSNLIGAVILK